MNHAEGAVNFLLTEYGSICPYRNSALSQLLFVIGNATEWVNGRLEYDDTTRERWFPEGSDPEYHLALEQCEKDFYANGGVYAWWYPLSDYSRIACVPDNVTPDWLAVCIEACEAYLATPEDAQPMAARPHYEDGERGIRMEAVEKWERHHFAMDKERIRKILDRLRSMR